MMKLGQVTAAGAVDTFERADSIKTPTKNEPPKKKVGFQPRTAVMHSGPKPGLTNVQVTRPMDGKVMVTAKEGYLRGTIEGGNELVVDIYEVGKEFRGRKLGQALLEAAIREINAYSLAAEMDYTNGQALRAANGDASQTPFGKAMTALGFDLIDKEGHYFIWAKK